MRWAAPGEGESFTGRDGQRGGTVGGQFRGWWGGQKH